MTKSGPFLLSPFKDFDVEAQESLTFVLVNPELNLFLLGARLHPKDGSVADVNRRYPDAKFDLEELK